MNYIERLNKEHSRAATDAIAKSIGNDPREIKKIIGIIYKAEAPLPQRASWLLTVISRKYPELITPYISLFINSLPEINISGIKRNMLNALLTQEIPKKLQGKIVSICFNHILSTSEPVAVKALSLEMLAKLMIEHPALQNEIKAVIEDQLPKTSMAFRSKGMKILKKLEKGL